MSHRYNNNNHDYRSRDRRYERHNGHHGGTNDKSFCEFYNRIGACRHGERCSRKHIKPTISDTILLANLYQNPKLNKNEGEGMTEAQLSEYFDHFYKDIFLKFATIGEVRNMVVCENDNNHLNGNVYVKFKDPDSAYNAVLLLNQQWFGARPVHCELSPVESFQDANCREYDNNNCDRGEKCNFMHRRYPGRELRKNLMMSQEKSVVVKKLQQLTGDPDFEQNFALQGNNVLAPAPSHQASEPSQDHSATAESDISSTAAVERLFAR